MERKNRFSGQRRILFLTIMAASCFFIAFVSPVNAEWQNGSGDITYNFTGYVDIWDISGTYDDSVGEINLDYVITQDAGGKLTGTGNASASMYGVDLDLSFDVKGTVSTKNSAAWIKMTLNGKGTASYDGELIKFSFSESVNAQVDPDSNTMTGTVKVRVSAQGQSASETVSFDESLPADMDGSATLSLSCAPSGKKILGTSSLILSNGDFYNFYAKGSYNVKKSESSFTLTYDRCNFKLKISEGNDGITSLKGKVLGQTLNATNIAP